MSTISNLTTAQLCSGTPTVSIVDNRGLSVRTLQYNRNAVGEAANELIAQQRYSVSGQLLSSIDPRLFAAQQADPAVLPNFRYHNSLSGQVLRSQSQDAGQQVTLYDIETGPVWQNNSRGHLRRFAYDGLHRLSTVHEKDGAQISERVSERYLYGEDQAHATNANCRGQLVRHYDTAGLNEVARYSISGQSLQRVRQLLRDDSAHSDWQGAENQWPVVLEPERHQSRIGYNALGEVLNSVDAKGNQQRQQLDVAGQLASSGLTLVGQAVERPILTSISYSAGGQVLREAASNGVVTDYRYEPQTQRLSRLICTRPPQVGRNSLLQDLSYVYDPVGNILSISDAAIESRYHNNQQIEPANDYQYDALYQLLTASGRENVGASRQGPGLPEPSSADSNQYSNYTRQYRYDHGGNLTRVRHVGNRNYTLDMLVSSTSNRAAQQTEFLTQDDVEGQFDAAGNLKQLVVGQPMTWDGRNQLQSVTQVLRSDSDDDEEHYQYDGGGTRVRKTTVSHTSGTTRRAQVIYLPGLELRRTESTQGVSTRLEEGLQVISVGSAGRQQVRVLHWEEGKPDDIANDQLRASLDNQIGSSLLELDQNADILTQEEYYPFGGTAVWSGKNASETKYKFVRYSGKERDVSGLYYYGFRYYAPWLGRWLNPDPAGTVDGLNLYRMVRNNPITFMDVDGLAPGDASIGRNRFDRKDMEGFASVTRAMHRSLESAGVDKDKTLYIILGRSPQTLGAYLEQTGYKTALLQVSGLTRGGQVAGRENLSDERNVNRDKYFESAIGDASQGMQAAVVIDYAVSGESILKARAMVSSHYAQKGAEIPVKMAVITQYKDKDNKAYADSDNLLRDGGPGELDLHSRGVWRYLKLSYNEVDKPLAYSGKITINEIDSAAKNVEIDEGKKNHLDQMMAQGIATYGHPESGSRKGTGTHIMSMGTPRKPITVEGYIKKYNKGEGSWCSIL